MNTDWSPVVEERTDLVSASVAAALHGLLDAPGPPPAAGDPMPPLWHWLAFRPESAQHDLGIDGHPNLGSFMPPTGLPRRMFAGGRIEFRSTLPVEVRLQRTSVVSNVSEKSGRSGRLVFVQISNQIGVPGAPPAIIETQHIVYREAATTTGAAGSRQPGDPPTESPLQSWEWRRDLGTEPTLLFRFSALTYNAHRIHYDRHYATTIEGYPGLVVQGPLQAIALAELLRQNAPQRTITAFSFRALQPAYDGDRLKVRGRLTSSDEAELRVIDGDGRPTMQAEAWF